MKQKLYIGVLVSDEVVLPAWEYDMIQQLSTENFVSSIVFIKSKTEKPAVRKKFLYPLFVRFENWWFGSGKDVMKKIKLVEQPAIKIIGEEEIESITTVPDLIYFSSVVNPIYEFPFPVKFGSWRLAFGKRQFMNADPPAFWEVMQQETVTGSALLIKLQERPGEIVVYDNTTLTIPFSVINNLKHLVLRSSSFLAYRLRELHELGSEIFFTKYKQAGTGLSYSQKDLLYPPDNFQMATLFIKNVISYLLYKIRLFKNQDRFTILISQNPLGGFPEIKDFNALPLSATGFMADPFIVSSNHKPYIFFEEFKEADSKAHISVMELKADGNWTSPVIVLQRPYHLSYPFVFEWEGVWYMIPETAANKTVELYRSKKFPHEWEFVKYLFTNVILIDCTLHFQNGKWWLFACTQNHEFTNTNDQLLLFYSDDLFSANWNAHPQNPIATDISNCRPAGKIFSKNGKWYRPAQNNAAQQYGYGIKINCIEVLNETEYRESEVMEYKPDKQNKFSAIHTLNFTEGFSVADGILK